MYTPWGAADQTTKITLGIIFYGTPGHGGFHLSPSVNKLMPRYFIDGSFRGLGKKGWWEEDCDACLVVARFPQHFNLKSRAYAYWYITTHENANFEQFRLDYPVECQTLHEAHLLTETK